MLTITPDQVNDEIASEHVFNVGDALANMQRVAPDDTYRVVLCAVVLKNGFVAVGQASVADFANFDAALGAKFAREDALRQAWPVVMSLLQERQRA